MIAVGQLSPDALIAHAHRLIGEDDDGSAEHALDLRRAASSAYHAVFHELCFQAAAQVSGCPPGSPPPRVVIAHLARAGYDRLAALDHDEVANAAGQAEEVIELLREPGRYGGQQEKLASQPGRRDVDLNDTPEQAAYRSEVRAWLDANASHAPRERGTGDDTEAVAAHRAWQRRLAEARYVGVTWPAEHGGGGRGPLEQVILNQEIARAGVPGILDVIGVGMLGPTIIAQGTDEQKQRYLGPMLHGDEVWCQLFSEPAAGSDLAGIQCRAKREDDGGWRITGQKVWTTNAQFSAFGLLLARTDQDAAKHKGLTMFIVPMDAPGVSIVPLRQISGEPEFNEVFFDDVRLEPGSEVGAVNGGWGVALTTLMFERLTIGAGSEGMGYRADRFAHALASDEAAVADPEVRHAFGELATELLALRFTGYRLLTALSRGQIPGPEAGLGKVTAVNAAIKAGDLIADVLGPETLAEGEWADLISFLPGLKSAGGTEEILRNTIGERVLGLPPEPRLDKGIPFSELRAKERQEVKA